VAEESVVAELAVKLGLVPDKESFEKGDELLHKLQEGLEFFAGFEAVKSLYELVEHTEEAAIANKHLAEKLGMSIEAVQELGYAADVSGASTEDMRVSMQHLSFAMIQAGKSGSGPLIDGLGKLKISFSEFKKASPDERIELLSRGFAAAGPKIDKTALAIEVFGRKGTALLPLLNKGPEGIKELREEFVALGAETSGETAEAFEKLEESQKRLKYAWNGLKEAAVIGLVPALKELTDGLLVWFRANREVIASTLQGVFESLLTVIKAFGWAVSNIVVPALEFLKDHSDVAKAILWSLATVISYVASRAFLMWVAAAGPFALVIGAIAAVIYIFEKLGMVLGAVAVGAVVALGLWGGGLTALAVALDAVGLSAAAAWIAVEGPLVLIVLGIAAVVAAVAGMAYAIYEYWDEIKEKAEDVGRGIKAAFSAAFDFVRHLPVIEQLFDLIAALDKLTGIGAGVSEGLEGEAGQTSLGKSLSGIYGEPSVSSGSKDMKAGDVTNHNNLQIDVHPSPGMKEEGLADSIGEVVMDKLNEIHRQAHADVGGR
jgi:hypothetical protein